MTTFAISEAARLILAARPEIGVLNREGLVVFYVTTDREAGTIVEAADPAELPSAEEVERLRAAARKPLTRKQVLAAIRELGMQVGYDPDAGEYRISFYAADLPDRDRREAVACYTNDGADAIATARHMRAEFDQGRER